MRIVSAGALRRMGATTAAGVVVIACSGPTPPPVAHQVAIRTFAYVPPTVRANVGDTIVWTNEDIVPHTATDTAHALSSGGIDSRGSWRHVVRRAGTYDYVCAFHPAMHGTLDVR